MFLLFVLFIISATAEQLALPSKMEVVTFTADWCTTSCVLWTNWTKQLSQKYTDVAFTFYDIDKRRDLTWKYNLTNSSAKVIHNEILEAPESIFLTKNGEARRFIGSRTLNGLDTWINNAIHEQFHPLFTTSSLTALGKWDKRWPASVTILSKKEPLLSRYLSEYPSVGYAWLVQDYSDDTTVFVRSLNGKISYYPTFNLSTLASDLLSPMIPYWMTQTPVGQDVIQSSFTREVHIFHDGPLPAFWDDFSTSLPTVAFVHFRKNETDEVGSKVKVFSRSVEYIYSNVSSGVVDWYKNIWLGNEEPFQRKSVTAAQQPSVFLKVYNYVTGQPNVYNATGNTLWSILKKEPRAWICPYVRSFKDCTQVFEKSDVPYARIYFDLSTNDHEIFMEQSRTGFIHVVHDLRLIDVKGMENIDTADKSEL